MSEHNGRDSEEPISKSQRKREMHALQALGRELTEASDTLLEKLPLHDKLRTAIDEYRRLPNKHEARRRQLQYIGRLMRDADSEQIQQIMDQSKQNVEVEKRRFLALEDLRAKLVASDEASLNWLIENHPQVDIQHLRQLIRQSHKEAAAGKPPAASRKLFRYLRETLRED